MKYEFDLRWVLRGKSSFNGRLQNSLMDSGKFDKRSLCHMYNAVLAAKSRTQIELCYLLFP